MGVGVARAPRRRLRLDGWSASSLVIAALVGLPLLTVPASFLSPRVGLWWRVTRDILPDAILNTGLLIAGVGAGTLIVGGGLAVLVSFYEFPGRRILDWALILPLAMPAYVLTFVVLGAVDGGPGAALLPDLRTPLGAVVVLTASLYPYVYLLGRSAFLAQSQSTLDAARSLGVPRLRAILRVSLPLARPALAAGTALALMEALADFGSVQLLGVRTLTTAIYQVWFGAFDRLAATQLATLLLAVTLTLLALERYLRGRARYADSAARGQALQPVRLHGLRAAVATSVPVVLLAVVFAGPVLQLVVWAVQSVQGGLVRADLAIWIRNSVMLSAVTAVIAALVALVLAYGLRVAPSRVGRSSARFASIGYGLPGSVVAVGVIVSLGFVDRLLEGPLSALGIGPALIFTGTALGLVFAYVVRFLAVAFQGLEARLETIPPNLDAAARGLGADRFDVLWRVHLPLLRVGLLTAGLLVFVETMKELPATVLLRPLAGETLAIGVFEATSESLWETAALPALAIVAVGVIPVVALVRLWDPGRARLLSTRAAPDPVPGPARP